ncbi:hypothetical protein PUN28_006040 [Cardiocondyla obscurior]|uniref:Uncharacterized protein n=1 Tax=Cardiocondyla obscurior TaxID=286306 RepID=A0AAW2G8F6_9HYME
MTKQGVGQAHRYKGTIDSLFDLFAEQLLELVKHTGCFVTLASSIIRGTSVSSRKARARARSGAERRGRRLGVREEASENDASVPLSTCSRACLSRALSRSRFLSFFLSLASSFILPHSLELFDPIPAVGVPRRRLLTSRPRGTLAGLRLLALLLLFAPCRARYDDRPTGWPADRPRRAVTLTRSCTRPRARREWGENSRRSETGGELLYCRTGRGIRDAGIFLKRQGNWLRLIQIADNLRLSGAFLRESHQRNYTESPQRFRCVYLILARRRA